MVLSLSVSKPRAREKRRPFNLVGLPLVVARPVIAALTVLPARRMGLQGYEPNDRDDG